MKRIKFDARGITKKFNNLASTMEKEIINAMTLKGVKAISFIYNGESTDYSVDNSWLYDYDKSDYTLINEKRIEILIVENGQLFIATSHEIKDKDLDFLDSADVFSPSVWNNANVDDGDFYYASNVLFSVYVLKYLYHSVKEVLMGLMKGKYLENGKTICFTER